MAASTTKPKRGRPRKPDSEKRRNNVTIRMRDAVKRRLKESAANAGRSLSEEIEYYLERKLLEEETFGGRELHGLLLLMVGTTEMIQERTGKPLFLDWYTWIATRAAWMRLMVASAPKPPPEFIQHVERRDSFDALHPLPEHPTLPKAPAGPHGSLLLATPDPAELEAYRVELVAYEKAMHEYGKRVAKRLRQFEALKREMKAWLDRLTSYQDLGLDVAADFLPNRITVT